MRFVKGLSLGETGRGGGGARCIAWGSEDEQLREAL